MLSTSTLNAIAQSGATAGMKMKHIPTPTFLAQCMMTADWG